MGAAILYVKRLSPMRAFYEVCFSAASVASGGAEFCVLSGGDWELTLVTIPEQIAATVVIADPPQPRRTVPVKLVFDVESIERVRPVLTAAGGRLESRDEAWEFRGRRHLDALDPEGNVLQLRERSPNGAAR